MATIRLYGGLTFMSYLHEQPQIGGKNIRPSITLDHFDTCDPLEMRIRPTGNTGSGPYFHAERAHESHVGVLFKDYNGEVTSCSFHVDDSWLDDTPSWPRRCYNYWYAAGDTFCVAQCQYSYDWPYGVVPNRYIVHTGRILRYSGSRAYVRTASRSENCSDDISVGAFVARWRSAIDACVSDVTTSDRETGSGYWRVPVELQLPDLSDFVFNHGELDAFEWWRISDTLPGRYFGLAQEAYIKACESFPQAEINALGNLIESIGVVRSILKGRPPKVSWKEFWLGYRYSYTTTRLDIEAYADLNRRLSAVIDYPEIKLHGQAERDGIVCHVVASVAPSSILTPDISGFLKTIGLELNLANAWDVVPFSFIADWFLHVGDFLESLDSYDQALNMPVYDVWTSFQTSDSNQSTYFRVPGRFIGQFPKISYRKASKKTIGMRVLDSIALFL